MAIPKSWLCLLPVLVHILLVAAWAIPHDQDALSDLKSSWTNWPNSWTSASDPCSDWEGINCNDKSRVISIKLAGIGLAGNEFGNLMSLTELQYLDLSNNIGLKGTLPLSIGNLKNLTVLILIGCSFFGQIPDSIGSLQQLVRMSLTNNSFNGPIPRSIGNLSKLVWLDLTGNKLFDNIPVSKGPHPGLDKLINLQHMHLGQNQLSGPIPKELFSPNMKLIHVILDHNNLVGEIPRTLGLVQTLQALRLDSNSLNGSVPDNLNNLTSLNELYLSSNSLSGSIPDLSGMNVLSYLDLSNNNFIASDVPPWFPNLQSLTTILMANTNLQGTIPADLFSLPQLETVVLSNNNLSGILDIGSGYPPNVTIDLQNNSITDFIQKTEYNAKIMLTGNPTCMGNEANARYCMNQKNSIPSLSTLSSNNCASKKCNSHKKASPGCICSHPQTGTLHFSSYSFSDLENMSYFSSLNDSLMSAFLSGGLQVESVSISNPDIDVHSYLQLRLQIFPSGKDAFNRTGYSDVQFLLNSQPLNLTYYGPFYYTADDYDCCFHDPSNKRRHIGIIIGVSVSITVLLLVCAAVYAFYLRSKAKRAAEMSNPFASWDRDMIGNVPQLREARWFSSEEMRKFTNNFSDTNCIGSGGYGKVYRGLLDTRELVAIKRAERGSMQGVLEFKTEIELLSRIHHKNVVSLLGFCYKPGEQMLVYEYIPNGTLRDSLSGKSGIRLSWMRRLKIALGAARGLAYLHELADPPIIHRDVKSNNILLDDNLDAKVVDFGLSKLIGEDADHVSTQVKGTMGYLDPEYYMTLQLTDRSDVYSFGVVLLELITAKPPIKSGKHVVNLVSDALDDQMDGIKLDHVLDPVLAPRTSLEGLQKFIELAMCCVQESASERPSMGEVVRALENIIQMARKVVTSFSLSSSSSSSGFEKGIKQSNFNGSMAFDYI